jgi:hypothetical protein
MSPSKAKYRIAEQCGAGCPGFQALVPLAQGGRRGGGQWAVYLCELLIGNLHAKDASSLRPASWQRTPSKRTP